jgi:membrane protease YdiL (CAAX protease family)
MQPTGANSSEYRNAPAGTEGNSAGALGIIVSWFIVALSIGALLYKRHSADEAAVLPAAPVHAADVQLRIASRYAVGIMHLLPGAQARATALKMLPQLDAAAHTQADMLRAAIVVAEIDAPAAALKRIDSLEIDSALDDALRRDAHTLRQIYGGDAGDDIEATTRPAMIDPAAREELVAHHGWFGKLALSWGLPASDPERRAALAPARRTAVAGICLVLGAIGLGLLGLAMFVVAIVLIATRSIRRAYALPPSTLGRFAPAPYVEAFALYLAWYIGMSWLAWRFEDRNAALSRALAISAIFAPLAALWPLARGVSWRDLKLGLGWHAGRGFFREIGAGVAGYVAGVPIFFAGILITLWISRHTGQTPSHPIVEQISSDPKRVLRLLLLASVYAPLFEETMFRGALYHHLRRWLVWPVAALVVAFIFASIHPQGWAGVPALMGLAFVFAAMREWRGSLVAPIVAHALNNTMLIVALVLMVG